MEARANAVVRARRRYGVALSTIILVLFGFVPAVSAQRQYRAATRNFVVSAPDQRLAQQAAELAEKYRRDLSLEWLGYEIAPWKERCPVQIEIGPNAGGETSFAFVDGRKSQPVGWQMRVFGPPNRILDSVLPHEVTHTIFATHFGQPLPRWADEGACTTVEHESERAKNHQLLMEFLHSKPSRGIPFNRMFTMKQYPHDILPLYAQGYSVAKFLIALQGRHTFIKFIEDGLEREAFRPGHPQIWDEVLRAHYGFDNLSDLQVQWLTWVRDGSDINRAIALGRNLGRGDGGSLAGDSAVATVADTSTPMPQSGLAPIQPDASQTFAVNAEAEAVSLPPANGYRSADASLVGILPSTDGSAAAMAARTDTQTAEHSGSWYLRQSRLGQAGAIGSANRSVPHIQRYPGSFNVDLPAVRDRR